MKSLRVVGAAGIVAAALAFAGPARAQIPELPAPLDPVLEVVGPVITPACGELGTAYELAPVIYSTYLGQPMPSQLLTLFSPLIVVCGSLPPLDPGAKLKCQSDKTTQQLLNQIAAAAGQQLPASPPALFAPVGAEVFAIQDHLPAPAQAKLPLAPLVATALQCEPVVPSTTPDVHPSTPETGGGTDGGGTDVTVGGGDFALPIDDGLVPSLPDTNTDLGAVALPTVRPPVLTAAGRGFAYPVVFALPLVILILGGFLGRALTEPVAAPRRP